MSAPPKRPRRYSPPVPLDSFIEIVLRAVAPARLVQSRLKLEGGALRLGDYRYRLDGGRIFLVAAGKAALAMSQPLLTLLAGRLAGGIIVSKSEPPPADLPANVQFFRAGHPLSNEESVAAAQAAADLLRQSDAGDLVICLISGGASALLSRPRLPLANWQTLNETLLKSGCAIQEFNAIRQQLDAIKGGGLARLAAPAACVSLILSDVVGNPPDMIGSGPTVSPTATPADARRILERYGLPERLPAAVWQGVEQGLAAAPDAPLPDSPRHYEIVGDVRLAAAALAAAATEAGFETQLLTAHLEGEAREVGRVAAALAKDLPPGQGLALGGETTVTLRGEGRGGRNQELALAAAIGLAGWPDRLVVALATDGEDGPTPAAGAWVTGDTVRLAAEAGLGAAAYLADNDSYAFFAQTGGLLETGPTGTNVNDLLLILNLKRET